MSRDEPLRLGRAQEWFYLLMALGILLCILKSDFSDIDKKVARSLTYATLIILLALAFELIFEPLAGYLSANFGLGESVGQTLLIVTAALGGPRLKTKLLPVLENWLAPPSRKNSPQ